MIINYNELKKLVATARNTANTPYEKVVDIHLLISDSGDVSAICERITIEKTHNSIEIYLGHLNKEKEG